MNFLKELLLSFFSGLATVFISKKREHSGVVISHNKKTVLKNIDAKGRVEITENDALEIDSGEFDG
mgnify:CR=1